MENELSKLFDYQRFSGNSALAKMIAESESRYARELSDDDLFMVSAAGEIENKNNDNRNNDNKN